MRGFIHVVEIVLIALVVFIIMAQFWYIPGLKSDWQRVKLTLLGQDVLLALDRAGANWLDASIENNLTALLGSGTTYSLEILGVPPSNITVGCNCSPTELEWIGGLLQPVEINGQKFTFFVEQAETFDLRYDLIIAFGQPTERTAFEGFLASGQGFLEILPNPSMDSIQQELFGLNSTTGLTEDNLTWVTEPVNAGWPIFEYFHTIPNSTGQKWSRPWQFENFLIQAVDAKVPIVAQGNLAGAAVSTVGPGRTAWLGAPLDDLQAREDLQTLLKALVLWTAGQSWTAVEGPTGIAAISYYTTINKDFFQPVEIRLRIRYIY